MSSLEATYSTFGSTSREPSKGPCSVVAKTYYSRDCTAEYLGPVVPNFIPTAHSIMTMTAIPHTLSVRKKPCLLSGQAYISFCQIFHCLNLSRFGTWIDLSLSIYPSKSSFPHIETRQLSERSKLGCTRETVW
jgi:hypothetical protein